MDYSEVMERLEAVGTAQNRKIYGRHGVKGQLFGVSMAELKVLHKKIKVDHALALALWESGNYDARYLATFIADPKQADPALLDRWVADVDNYGITDAFVGFAARTAHIRAKAEAWTPVEEEWRGRAGWHLLSHLAAHDTSLPDGYFLAYLPQIEARIHTAKNRIRDAMNMAVINIAVRNPALEAAAIATAKRIGKIDVDHGETSCETPDAIAYIGKIKARAAQKKQKAGA